MTLLYPLGLLGLIGIPVLILIYIIKNKYTEQTVSSTYLWTLSERFLKKKNPLNRITGIISLILQILAVILLSFGLAHPLFVVTGGANEYCFVLDASASMNMKSGDDTRFELAKKEISSLLNGAVDGSSFTLVYAGGQTNVIFERVSSKSRAQQMLDALEPSYTASGFTEALSKAQEYFDENPSALTYLVTDKSVLEAENVTVIDVSDGEVNYALSDLGYSISYADSNVTVKGKVVSYTSDASLTVNVYLDGGEEIAGSAEVAAEAGTETSFEVVLDRTEFSSVRAAIAQEDALALDNESIVYNYRFENAYKILLVSRNPFFLSTVMETVSGVKPEVLSPDDYDGQTGYTLYIFDAFSPSSLPTDGAVWLFGATDSIEGSGFSSQGEVELAAGEKLVYSTSSSSAVQTLLDGVPKSDIYVKRYAKYGLYQTFSVLLTLNGSPAVFAGLNDTGNREVVFAFSLNDSNLPALFADFTILMRNFLDYSFPALITETSYLSGEEAQINVVSGCTGLRAESPLGNVTYLDTSGATSSLSLSEVGTYTITATVSGELRTFRIYSSLALEERSPVAVEDSFALSGTQEYNGTDGQYDPILIVLILLAAVFLADWGVYCYEQRQLR